MVDTSPYHDRDGFIWYDGKLVPWREANVHVLTHALHYASAVFEGERAYGGEIFELTKHSQRLYDGAKTMDFTIPYSVAEIDQACRDTIKANNLSDCYVRPIAWRGSEMMGVSAQSTKIHLSVAAWDWGSYFPIEERLKGLRLTVAKYRRPDPATAPAKTKAAGLYMICTIEKHRAERLQTGALHGGLDAIAAGHPEVLTGWLADRHIPRFLRGSVYRCFASATGAEPEANSRFDRFLPRYGDAVVGQRQEREHRRFGEHAVRVNQQSETTDEGEC
mgnify:CR=1 FL=1